MKKLLSLAAALTLSATFMTGCGSSDTSSSSKSSTELTTTASGTEAKKTTTKPKKTTEPTTEATTEATTEQKQIIELGKKCESKNIIDGLYLGMTKDEVLELLGEYQGTGSNAAGTYYIYDVDNIELFDINKHGIFEVTFNDFNDLLIRYRYDIGFGHNGEFYNIEDFDKDVISSCLDKAIKGLTEKFGDSDKIYENADLMGFMDSKVWSKDITGIGDVYVWGGVNLWTIENQDVVTIMVESDDTVYKNPSEIEKETTTQANDITQGEWVTTYYVYPKKGAIVTWYDPETGDFKYDFKCEVCGSTYNAGNGRIGIGSEFHTSGVCRNNKCSMWGKGQEVIIAGDTDTKYVD